MNVVGRWLGVCTLVLSLQMLSISPGWAGIDVAAHQQSVQTLFARMMRHTEQSDVLKLVEMYSDDAVLIYPGEHVIHGREQILQFYQAVFSAEGDDLIKSLETSTRFINVEYPFAFLGIEYTETQTHPDGRIDVHRGQVVTQWRHIDGQWRIIVDLGVSD